MKNIKLGVLTLTLLSSAVLAEGPATDGNTVPAPTEQKNTSNAQPPVDSKNTPTPPATGSESKPKTGLWNSVQGSFGAVSAKMPSSTLGKVAVGTVAVAAVSAAVVYRKEIAANAKKLWTKMCKNPKTTLAIAGAVVLAGLGYTYGLPSWLKSWVSKAPKAPEAAKEVVQEGAKELAKEVAKEGAKEVAKEGAKEVAKEGAKEVAKEGAKEVVQEVTKKAKKLANA